MHNVYIVIMYENDYLATLQCNLCDFVTTEAVGAPANSSLYSSVH